LAEHYGIPAEDYWGDIPKWTPAYFKREIAAAKRLIDFQPGMKALDVGVGSGAAMLSLEHADFEAWGLEPSAPFRKFAIATRGVCKNRVQLAAVEEAEYPAESFDFITFGAVLEHLYDPRAALQRALNWLKPGGVIQVEVPSADWLIPKLVNAFFRLRGTNYVTHISPMHSPFHLYEFTTRSFRDFNVADHWLAVCGIPHVPHVLHPALRWIMERTGTGMQLTVYLRKPAA
jgi:SAM-dependent methyltransferase